MNIDSWIGFKPDPERRHETFEGDRLLVNDISILGWLQFKKALPNALHPTKHVRMYEVFYIIEGKLDWFVGGVKIKLQGGDIIVIAPGILHGSEASILQPCVHYWLRFKIPERQRIAGLTIGETQDLLSTINKMTDKRHFGDSECQFIFRKLLECHRQGRQDRLASAVKARALFQLLLTKLASYASPKTAEITKSPTYQKAKIEKSLRLLHNKHLTTIPTISDLAQSAGLKESTYRRMFEREIGITPSHYISSWRIGKAKEFLLAGENITDVAHRLLYPSSQYFATVFKQWTGFTPTEFVKRK